MLVTLKPNNADEHFLHRYPVGTKTQESEIYESLLEQFYDQLSTVTATRPLMASPGNHEANCVNSGAKDKHSGVTYSVDYCLPGQNNFTVGLSTRLHFCPRLTMLPVLRTGLPQPL